MEIEVIGVNDNMPTFDQSEYRLQVLEDEPIGSLIGQVKATDLDGDTLMYSVDGDIGMIF